jgi:15-cis-phytoene synthase
LAETHLGIWVLSETTPNTGSALSLEDSYAQCVEITKTRAKNFHFAFQVLPPLPYKGICALYAFARRADDYSDDEKDTARALANAKRFREAFDRALDGDASGDPVLPAVAETVRRCRIPREYFHELIAGTEMDATVRRYATWDESYKYCYRVASVVGLMTIHVFGFSDPAALPLAERTGIAFQLTNILRDIKEDAGRDRIYLPQEDLKRHQVTEEDVQAGRDSPAFRALVRFEVERAREYYRAGDELLPLIHSECRPALAALVTIYGRLLEEIARRDYDVLSKRVSLSVAEKIRLAGRFAVGTWLKS